MQACSEKFQSDARATDVLKCESREKPEFIFVLKNKRLADGAVFPIFCYGKQRHLLAKAFERAFTTKLFQTLHVFSLFIYTFDSPKA